MKRFVGLDESEKPASDAVLGLLFTPLYGGGEAPFSRVLPSEQQYTIITT